MTTAASREEEKKEAAQHGLNFTDAESFGLFMDGLRSMKEYTQESEKDTPNPDLLRKHLEDALFRLGKCEAAYPNDILPLYMLGIALTMKNQIEYAKMLIQYGAAAERRPREVPQIRPKPGQRPSGQSAHTGSQRGQIIKTLIMAEDYAAYLMPPATRPWPLLSHAQDLFKKVMEEGPLEMRTSAKFNLAHISSKRDAPGDLEYAAKLLGEIGKSPQRENLERSMETDVRSMIQGKKAGEKAESRATQEALVIWLQSQTLLASVAARKLLHNSPLDGGVLNTGAATVAISKAQKEIDAAELPASIKTDLQADCWTKAGFIAYEQAFALNPDVDALEFDARLNQAEDYLNYALELKPNWNPAQTYMAQVLQAQERMEEAAKYLEAVIGKPVASAAAKDASKEAKPEPAKPQSKPE